MISEKEFALSHSGFWKQLLPLAEEYIRTTNRELGRFCPPLVSPLPPDTRGVVNEIGFQIFAVSIKFDTSIEFLSQPALDQSIRDGLRHIRALREHGRPPVPHPTNEQINEAIVLAKRLDVFLRQASPGTLIPSPIFRGCGWVNECAGDVLGNQTLFEVKAGDRRFRSIDVRQVLIYCALNSAATTYDISRVCLVNPRLGVFFEESLDELCGETAGRSATDVLNEIVQFASEERDRYAT